MLTFIVRRLLQLIPVFIGTTFLIFAMVYGLGDPTQGRCGERSCPPSYVARLTEEYHLDQPLIIQYGYYLLDLVQGNLGTTFNGQEVGEELLLRYPTTIKLALIALAFEMLIGVVAGVLAGIYRGSFLDYLVTVSSLVVISVPIFVLGGMAQLLFGIIIPDATNDRLGLPATATDGTIYQLLMPGLVLGSVSVAYIARLLRASLVENFRADYVRTARAKGLTNGRVIGVHTMRNSMIPVITYIGTDVGALMGGAVVTERIFNVNGIGGYLFRSITTKQGAAVVGTITVLVIIYLLANLLVDVLYGYLDPRISHD